MPSRPRGSWVALYRDKGACLPHERCRRDPLPAETPEQLCSSEPTLWPLCFHIQTFLLRGPSRIVWPCKLPSAKCEFFMLAGHSFPASCLSHVGGFGPLEMIGMPAQHSVPFFILKCRSEGGKGQGIGSFHITQRVLWASKHGEHHQPQKRHPHSTVFLPQLLLLLG